MHQDLVPLIGDLERAVAARDSRAAAVVLCRLNDVTIYSGNEVYDRLQAVKGNLVVVLFEGLEPAAFGQLLANDKHLLACETWEALEKVAERVSADALWAIKALHDSVPFVKSQLR